VTVRLSAALIKAGVEAGRTAGPRAVRAATIGAAAEAVGLPFGRHVTAVLNADEINADEINANQITRDASVPLAAGDTVLFMPASS
jgi:molybdopterin-guanine dinucleotide biosynthesis protein A